MCFSNILCTFAPNSNPAHAELRLSGMAMQSVSRDEVFGGGMLMKI